MSNRNILWATTFVDELARSGLDSVCAAPGSRHTPLLLAFAKHPDIHIYSHLDERSASFFALGRALATNRPVALICTSGTAGANMYPAIIEAHQSRVPLLVLTADRPHELRHSGANQTIDQIKMFGEFALWSVDMQLPEAQPPVVALRNLRTTANRAYATANGMRKGVVHLNFPFRKPLEPTPVEDDMTELPDEMPSRDGQYTQWYSAEPHPTLSPEQTTELQQIIADNNNGLIICGGINNSSAGHAVTELAERTGYPVLAESYSHARHGFPHLGGYDFYAQRIPPPDVIIRLGNVPISKPLNTLISRTQPDYFLQVSDDGVWQDDSHLTTHVIHDTIAHLAHTLNLPAEQTSARDTPLVAFEDTTWQSIDTELDSGDYFDGAVLYDVVDLIPPESTLFAGNSLPVRHLDQFGKPQCKRIFTYANRGASGIDGNISTALGAGTARPEKPLVAVLGDITFYHDMNGLLAVHRCGVPVTIVLLNNDGGGIFNRLPIRDYDPEFTDYFITPHGLEFSHAATLYGLDHIVIDAYSDDARQQFRQAFTERVHDDASTIIEVQTNSQRDEKRRQDIVRAVHTQLDALN